MPRYERGDRRFESSRGYEASERSSTGECRPDMPEAWVQLPPLAQNEIAPGSIWRGCPAVYRVRQVRFPSGARPKGAWRNGTRGELKPRPHSGFESRSAHERLLRLDSPTGRGRALRPHAVRVRIPLRVRTTTNHTS